MADTARNGSEDPGPLSDVDAGVVTPDEDVIDISQNDGPELTTDVDDVDPGSAGGVATGAEPPD